MQRLGNYLQKTYFVWFMAIIGLWAATPVLASKNYTFTYTYVNGDSYQGSGYINSSALDYASYVTGYTKSFKDESLANGVYKITGVTLSTDETKNGQVFVSKYFDKESSRNFSPVSMGLKAVGSKGLGSEYDYILETGKKDFYFGYNSTYGYIAEADVSCIYSFNYTFGNGDYYLGTVYAQPNPNNALIPNYKVNDVINKIDENGQMGIYKITSLKGYSDHSKDGQVFISQYFNSENKQLYNPVYTFSYVKYLGKEYGWIIKKNEAQFYFGNYNDKNYEADVGTSGTSGTSGRYTFKATFSNSDYYTGFAYAPASKGYKVGYKQNFTDESGKVGSYEITQATLGFDASRDGQVFVDKYWDAESKLSFKPVNFITPEVTSPFPNTAKGVGLTYLGSEKDYIIRSGVPEYFFGYGIKNGAAVIYEADVVWMEYNFSFSYANGDSYAGRVWSRIDSAYVAGYTKTVYDENGGKGYYRINSSTALISPAINNASMGQVFVDKYYDRESKANFTPVSKGDAVGYEFLGSEYDYILQAGNPELAFGGGYYEADVSCAYSFKFAYGNGDYYTGTVYAPAGYVAPPALKDENNLYGKYTLTQVTAYGDSSRNGQVYLSRYFDIETRKLYTPLENFRPRGASYLGSEVGYIISKTALYLFGKSGALFYEAN